jgi:hypothetical protein
MPLAPMSTEPMSTELGARRRVAVVLYDASAAAPADVIATPLRQPAAGHLRSWLI